MALTISSILVVLISTVFLVQNRYYAVQVGRSAAHDVARSVTEIVASEVRGAAAGGITTAQRDSLTVRSPMVVAGVCASQGSNTYVLVDGGEDALDTAEIAGVGVYNDTTGVWSFYNESWQGGLDGGTTQARSRCSANGADTVGASDDFLRIRRIKQLHGSLPPPGTLIMLFRETTFALRSSQLDTASIGLYRRSWGDTLLEYATGLDTTAQFQYRRFGQSTYQDAVSGGQLGQIDAVRIVAEARRRVQAGGEEDVTYGWSANIPLRNAR